MDKETFFFTLFVIWYFRQYGLPHMIMIPFMQIYFHMVKTVEYCNSIMNPFFVLYENSDTSSNNSDTNEEAEKNILDKPEVKYEDKYLEDIRKLDKEFHFDEQEVKLMGEKFVEFYSTLGQNYFDKLEKIKDQIALIEIKLKKYEGNEDDYCICDKEDDDYNNLGQTREERIQNLLLNKHKILQLKNDLNQEYEGEEGKKTLIKKAQDQAREFIIKQRLEKLRTCYIIEHTPLGNLLMVYDIERETFKYYSDNSIPYRYLEVTGRKYVKQFSCRPIFVDMEEELKLAEERWEKEQKEKEEEKRMKEESLKNKKPIQEKKNVFAKFKTYNKEAGTGHVNIGAPTNNNIPNKKLTEQQENEKILLKEKANRYTYEGKFANFSFIKKIDKKIVNKKLALSFSDFKKLQMNKK
jgi:hypothetical protein